MTGVGYVATKYRTERTQPPRDRGLGELAARQHGVVALSQLRALGLSASAVRSRVAAGKLHRVYRGVYAVGHPVLNAEGRWLAAVLACGPSAVLSHRSAAALWGIRKTARSAVEVTVPGQAGRRRAGIEVHRGGTLQPRDGTTVSGIPCTTVPRTLLDLGEVLGRRALERACDQAEVLRILDAGAVREVLAHADGRRGAPILRAVLDEHRFGQTLTRSELEERFLALCRGAGVPQPRVNAWVELEGGGVEVDFLWISHRLVAETDGHASHGTRRAFELDRARDRRLLLAGWRVVRFTWRQVTFAPAEVTSSLRKLLG
jgi:putative AbiEi antitoxin of type IV toxin-antitoxin system/uncharacterized protein DUF559